MWQPRPAVFAIAVHPGVLVDEAGAFRTVFSAVPGAVVMTVGAVLGEVAGPGGVELVTELLADDRRPDVVAVPGGLGSHRHPEIAGWLRRVRPAYVLSSSTGSALLAAGGLLRGRRATTHWLAGDLLTRHGVGVTGDRITVDPPFVTCRGSASIVPACDLVLRALGGERLVRRVHARMHPGVAVGLAG